MSTRIGPVTMQQERVLLAREIGGLRNGTNGQSQDVLSAALHIGGRVELENIKRTLSAIVRRHPTLRSAITPAPDVTSKDRLIALERIARTGVVSTQLYCQTVTDEANVEIEEIKCDGIASLATYKKLARECVRAMATRPFDYQKPPLLRATVVTLARQQTVVILTIDHLACDLASIGIVMTDFGEICRSVLSGGALDERPRSSGLDYALWQRKACTDGTFEKSLTFWMKQWTRFAGGRIGSKSIPFSLMDRRVPVSFGEARLELSATEVESFRLGQVKSKSTLFMLFCACMFIVWHHYTGKTIVAIWIHFMARMQPEWRELVGFLNQTHLVGVDLGGLTSASDVVEKVRSGLLAAMEHQEMPLGHLWNTLQRYPRFRDAVIILDYYYKPKREPFAQRDVDSVPICRVPIEKNESARMAGLGVYVVEDGDSIAITARFDEGRFGRAAVCQMLVDIREVLRQVVSEPQRSLSDTGKEIYKFDGMSHGYDGMDEFISIGLI